MTVKPHRMAPPVIKYRYTNFEEMSVNTLQDSLDWLITVLHEISHYENDYGNFNNLRLRGTLEAEGWVVRESKVRMKTIFNKKYDIYKVN